MNRVDQTSSWFEPGVNLSLVTQKEGVLFLLACGCRKCQKDTVQEDPPRVVEVLPKVFFVTKRVGRVQSVVRNWWFDD